MLDMHLLNSPKQEEKKEKINKKEIDEKKKR